MKVTRASTQPMKPITVPTSTDAKTLKALRENGFIPIVTDQPWSVQLVTASTLITDVAFAGMASLTSHNVTEAGKARVFVETLEARLKLRDSLQKGRAAP